MTETTTNSKGRLNSMGTVVKPFIVSESQDVLQELEEEEGTVGFRKQMTEIALTTKTRRMMRLVEGDSGDEIGNLELRGVSQTATRSIRSAGGQVASATECTASQMILSSSVD